MRTKLILMLAVSIGIGAVDAQTSETKMNRIDECKANYRTLFGGEPQWSTGTDPELMEILQKYIFGEVFTVGELDLKTRELITVVSLTTMQTLPQLKGHAAAALRVGVTPVELREAIYQCAPFIGFPRTLNAVAVLNEVLTERGIALPLESQGTVTEENRYERGRELQYPLYGDKMKEAMKGLPDGMDERIPRFLTEVGFGDFYTRGVLDVKQRELLSFCALVALGFEYQIKSHAEGNLRAGTSREILYAAMVQAMPYIGFPSALNAIKIVRSVEYEP